MSIRWRAPIDGWISRYAKPDPAALAAARHQVPAIVVTGGSTGIGLALAERFATPEQTLVLIARHEAQLRAAAEKIRERTGTQRLLTLPLDITNPDAVERLQSCLDQHRLYADILVNNAGIGLSGQFHEQQTTSIDAVLQLNILAATRLMRHFLPPMLARARGGILNVASLAAYAPGPHQAAYYASKAYLLSLSEATARECAGRGVRICAVAPGPVETRFHSAMGAERALYRWLVPSISAEAVAASAYRAYWLGRHVAVPGVLPTALMLGAWLTPHPLLTRLLGHLLDPGASPGNTPEPPA